MDFIYQFSTNTIYSSSNLFLVWLLDKVCFTQALSGRTWSGRKGDDYSPEVLAGVGGVHRSSSHASEWQLLPRCSCWVGGRGSLEIAGSCGKESCFPSRFLISKTAAIKHLWWDHLICCCRMNLSVVLSPSLIFA